MAVLSQRALRKVPDLSPNEMGDQRHDKFLKSSTKGMFISRLRIPPTSVPGGSFIAFEGIDGSGKSTQSVLLYQNLIKAGYSAFHTRPGEEDKAIASKVMIAIKKITHNPAHFPFIEKEAEAMLYMAQAAQATAELIIPNLKKGRIVVADRFIYSAYALCHYGRGIDFDFLKRIGNFVTKGMVPDIIILTDVPAKVAFERKERSKKPLGRKELMGPEFFEKVRKGFLDMAKKLSPERWFIVDDSKLSIKEAEERIWAYVRPRLLRKC